jgi:hypothetical protein
MEDDLNFYPNGRQPQFFQKWKTTSTFSKMEDDLNIFKNGRRPQLFKNGIRPQFFQIKTTLKPKFILGLAKLSKIFCLDSDIIAIHLFILGTCSCHIAGTYGRTARDTQLGWK